VRQPKYYCEADEHQHLKIHKGDKSSPVIATATQNLDKDGITEIQLVDTEPSQSLQLKHVPGFFHGKTFFEIAGKAVHWKGQSGLVEDDTVVCLALYKKKFFERSNHKLGTLLVTAHGAENINIIVSSALVEQERTDEAEVEVQFGISDLLTFIVFEG
jgi:hypothetical protein